jgi:hypothetical protein
VSVDVGNGQQQLKQNQKEQHLNSPNQQLNDDSALLAQRMEKVEKELFVNQDAFNRNVHEEFEKIHEDRRVSSPSRTQDANARRRCILS